MSRAGRSNSRNRSSSLAQENRRLAETNSRLRRVIADMAEWHEVELAVERAARKRLELQVAELARRVGMDSSNSSTPPSKEPLVATERRKAVRAASQRVRSKDRKPGGQPGRDGAWLAPAEQPDRAEAADPPDQCSSCQGDLSGGRDIGAGWAQVWDVLPAVLESSGAGPPTAAATGTTATTPDTGSPEDSPTKPDRSGCS